MAKVKAHLRRILPNLASALDVLKSLGGELKVDRSKLEAYVKGTRTRWSVVPADQDQFSSWPSSSSSPARS